MEAILRRLFEFRDTIKLFHFQTNSYGAHKASDALEKDISKLLDVFMEVLQGIEGRRVDGVDIRLHVPSLITKKNVSGYCVSFQDYIKKLLVKFNKAGADDLANILADMLAKVNQFLYLLTFK